jgi:amino acid transporter
VIAGGIYAVLAFIGFEASAPLAEETADPRRNILKAVVYSAFGIGLFYVLTTYAAAVFFGPGRMAGLGAAGGGDPWELMAHQAWSWGWIFVFLAVVNSAIANSNAGANATTRTWYAMGRIRLLPAMMARLHPRFRSPHIAVILQFIIGLALPLTLGFAYEPLTAFGFIATINVIVVVMIYILLNISCLALYLREHRAHFNPLLHLVIPVLGVAVFLPTWLAAAGIRIFSFVAPLAAPSSYAGIIDAIWIAIGVVYLVYLYMNHPERVRETGRIFWEEPQMPEPVPPTPTPAGSP